ncbi:target of Nesh-SH3 isoform X2 [Numida meleagris]|uniref:target of Nesh-SH3 isoform X2 n=1 Tax=Numida meleagris TaxID=8996 RepID=UPI000B3DD7AC|nr:target of Nesh-SH3 isoform X2 [Numida meleagris]
MMPRLVLLLFCGYIAVNLGSAQKLPRVKRQSLKVQINATDDTVCMRYLRPSQNTKLEGFVLGYGSSFFSNQYIPLPSEGNTYINELDAEPRYLVSVRPARVSNNKKSCSGRNKNQKPLQLVVGTLTPTSVFLSWGILVNPQHDWTATSNCASDRFYTVRYREKDKDKKWVFQLCPVTETVVDNLKPNTLYEFGVKDNMEDSIWSKTFNHKTVLSNKKVNGQFQNMYKLVPNTQSQLTLRDNKKLVPVTIIKQVIQNRTQSKTSDSSSLPGAILVHLIVPGLNETQQKLLPPLSIDDITQVSRKKLGKNETQVWPAESKTPEVQEISPQSLPAQVEKKHGPKEFKSTPKPELQTQSILAPKEIPRITSKPKPSPKPHIPQAEDVLESVTFRTDQPKPTIVPKESHRIPSRPRASPSSEVPQTKPVLEPIMFRTEKPKSTSVPRETRHGPSKPKTSPSPRVLPTRASPKESRRVTSKPRTSPSPDVPHTKPAPKETQQTSFKPKPAPIPDAPQRKPGIIPSFREPDTTMIPQFPERIKATLAATEKQFIHTKPKTSEKPRVPHTRPAIHQTTPQPITTKTSTTTEQSRATMAPKETLLIPSKPKTSVETEVPQTKPAPKTTHLGSINLITVHVVDGSKMTLVPNETYQISPKPKTALTTEIPWLYTAHKTRLTSARPRPSDKSQARPALSKTTVAPARTKAPGLPKWIVPTTDDVYTPEDIARHIAMDVKKPLEYIDTWEKPFSVITSPRPQHPPIPPVKPTPMRRKPLPPNTVTGKPGIPAKPAGPTMPVRTGVPYKTPTAFATPEYYVDATVFSSSPTSETDSSGKPRYLAPHVKYMKKDDDVPCSITSSLEHFPQEEAGIKEEPTRPPQNPPTNLTVVTVEGCPTFVILDWEKPDNDTVTEYEVVSTENGATDGEKEKSIITTNQTHSTVENLKPDTSYEFHVKPRNPLGEGPSSNVVAFSTESADPRVSEPISMGKDAIWTEIPFNSDTYSECKGKQYVKRTWYKKFVGVQLCNSLRYKIYLSDSLTGKFYNIGDQRGHGEDHCQFVDSFLDGRTGQQDDLPVKDGFFRAVRQEPVKFGKIGGETHINYVRWYECGTSIPGKW